MKGRLSLHWLVELFAVFNLAFLALDVWLAHSANDFADSQEWLPVVFSLLAPLVLAPGLFAGRYRTTRGAALGIAVGLASIGVGVSGLVLHLRSAFFVQQTLGNLVYSAPFVAPLSYVGVGLLVILNRLQREQQEEWGLWVVMLALGGFAGNFGLSLLDHAQNGFFRRSEWLPVAAAAFAASFLLMVVLGETKRGFLKLCLGVMAIQVLVGLAGAGLHLRADLSAGSAALHDDFVHGAPVFAPLLFADLALLAGIGLWHRLRSASLAEAGDAQKAGA